MAVDASGTGWGAVYGATDCRAPKTSQGSSVTAEPEGLWRALQCAALQGPRHILVLTDHLPIVFAQEKGRAKAWSYGALLARIATLPFRVTIAFLAGEENPADGPSRQRPITQQEARKFTSLATSDEVNKRMTKELGKRPFFMT